MNERKIQTVYFTNDPAYCDNEDWDGRDLWVSIDDEDEDDDDDDDQYAEDDDGLYDDEEDLEEDE